MQRCAARARKCAASAHLIRNYDFSSRREDDEEEEFFDEEEQE